MEIKRPRPKSIKRLSINRKSKSSLPENEALPTPSFVFEDLLVSQLQPAEVLHNCIPLDEEDFNINNVYAADISPLIKKKHTSLYHRCYHDTKFTPLWQAFACLDCRSSEKVLLGPLMNLSSKLSCILGEDHKDTAVQKHFIDTPQVFFSKYKQYVLDTTHHKVIDVEKINSICWSLCKDRFLNNPLVDNLDSVVPAELASSLYWLFCIFHKLTEPGTYPPSMDYEETELLLRKLLAFLGMPWTSAYDDPANNFDTDKNEDCEPSAPLLVTFQQLLSVIADMIGGEIAQSTSFYRAVQQLCLIEYQEVVKTGWIMMRKAESDVWKKRWAVLQGTKLTFYVTVLCQYAKEEIAFSSNMHVEALPGSSSHKHRFRIVEKEGFNIKCEHEFSTSDSTSSQSWIALVNITMKINNTGMSAKTSEICERRLERLKRRESEKEVFKKKQDVLQAFEGLENARKMRNLTEESLIRRAQQRKAQTARLQEMNNIYEKLESIQRQRRIHNQEAKEKRLVKLFKRYEKSLISGDILQGTQMPETEQSKVLCQLNLEQSQLEQELERLKMNTVVPNTSIITTISPRKSSMEPGCDFSWSSSENMSSTATDLSLLTLPEATSLCCHK